MKIILNLAFISLFLNIQTIKAQAITNVKTLLIENEYRKCQVNCNSKYV
jgi:hypothetical protein